MLNYTRVVWLSSPPALWHKGCRAGRPRPRLAVRREHQCLLKLFRVALKQLNNLQRGSRWLFYPGSVIGLVTWDRLPERGQRYLISVPDVQGSQFWGLACGGGKLLADGREQRPVGVEEAFDPFFLQAIANILDIRQLQ